MPPDKCIDAPERECLGLHKAAMLEKALNDVVENARMTHREIFDRIRMLEIDNARRDEQHLQIISKLDDLSAKLTSALDDVGRLEAKPAKRWEAIVDKVILIAVSSVIAFVLGRIGL